LTLPVNTRQQALLQTRTRARAARHDTADDDEEFTLDILHPGLDDDDDDDDNDNDRDDESLDAARSDVIETMRDRGMRYEEEEDDGFDDGQFSRGRYSGTSSLRSRQPQRRLTGDREFEVAVDVNDDRVEPSATAQVETVPSLLRKPLPSLTDPSDASVGRAGDKGSRPRRRYRNPKSLPYRGTEAVDMDAVDHEAEGPVHTAHPPVWREPYRGYFERRDLPRFDISHVDPTGELRRLSLEELEARAERKWWSPSRLQKSLRRRTLVPARGGQRAQSSSGGPNPSREGRPSREGIGQSNGPRRSGNSVKARDGDEGLGQDEEPFTSSWGSFPPLARNERKDWLGYGEVEHEEEQMDADVASASLDVAPAENVDVDPAGRLFKAQPVKVPKKRDLSSWLMPSSVPVAKPKPPQSTGLAEPMRRGVSKFAKMFKATLRKLGPLPWDRVDGLRSWTEAASETWQELGITGPVSEQLIEVMDSYGVYGPNVLQAQAVPAVMKGDDALLTSGTGSGKTLAFLVPLLHKHVLPLHAQGARLARFVDPFQPVHEIPKVEAKPLILIVCPSRELASQTHRVLRDLLKPFPELNSTLLIGGANHKRQDESLKFRLPTVVVGTPGRIVDHATEGRLVLSELRALVLDEVDMLLSVSRQDHLAMLMRLVPPPHRSQRILVSATGGYTDSTADFAKEHMRKPWLHIGPNSSVELPPRVLHLVNPAPTVDKKLLFLQRLANSNPMPSGVLVFCNNFERARKVAEQLRYMNIPAEVLSGNRSKESRERAVRNMDLGKIDMLVATDVATRGLDFREMTHVVNFEIPGDSATYAHRAGRCGRMGRNGIVISLASGGANSVRLSRYSWEADFELVECNVQDGELGVVEQRAPKHFGTLKGKRKRTRPARGPKPFSDRQSALSRVVLQ